MNYPLYVEFFRAGTRLAAVLQLTDYPYEAQQIHNLVLAYGNAHTPQHRFEIMKKLVDLTYSVAADVEEMKQNPAPMDTVAFYA